MTLFRPLRFLLRLALAAAPASAQARSASPTYEQIGALVQGGLDALARGDTAAYLDGTGKAFAIAPRVPPVAYHHARAHALARRTDSALALLTRLATEGAVVAHEAPADSAFDRIRRSPEWSVVAARIEASRAADLHQQHGLRASRARPPGGRHGVGRENPDPLPEQPL